MSSYTDLVASVYRRENMLLRRHMATSNDHIRVDVDGYPVPESEIKLRKDKFGYFRLALLDRHIDELKKKNS
jgi:hypothetical protein